MIKSDEDWYQEVNSIIDVLKKAGNTEFAEELFYALGISQSKYEIYDVTGMSLKRLYKTKLPDELNIREKVEESLKYLVGSCWWETYLKSLNR